MKIWQHENIAFYGNNKTVDMLHQIKKDTTFYTDLGLQRLLNPPVNGKIQRLLKALECFSSTFQGKFNFQDSQSCIFKYFSSLSGPGLAGLHDSGAFPRMDRSLEDFY